ncbi:kinase-like domain-containing protein [Lyophyllum atratum]|nr:kinase-like domain-containing protein [Lyophyllum atratum]
MSFSKCSTPSPKSSSFSNLSSNSSGSFGEPTPTRTLLDFQFLKRIGSGLTGQVFLAIDNRSDSLVAVKVISKSKGLDEWVLSEQDIQASLDDDQVTFLHPLLCSWHDTQNFYLVTDYLGGNDMAIELGVAGKFNEDRVRFYAAELVVALEQLQTRKIIHRDIKPSNILFTREGHLRLTDFGLSKKFYPTTAPPPSPASHSRVPFEFIVNADADSGVFVEASDTQLASFTANESVGTPAYMSVEMHKGLPYSFGVDTHAVGVLIYRMLTGKLPFGESAATGDGMRQAVINDALQFSKDDNVSALTQEFIRKLLVKDSHDLMSLEEIKAHAYFQGVNWGRVVKQTLTPPWKPLISPTPKVQEKRPVEKGQDYESSDPHPEFQFTSARMDRPKEVAGTGDSFRKKVGSFFDTVAGKNVMPPVTPSKSSPRATSNVHAAPDMPIPKIIGEPQLVLSTMSIDPITPPKQVRRPTWPVQHSPPCPTAIVFPILHPELLAPRDQSDLEYSEAISPAASKATLRGRLPSPGIRRALRSRPRAPDVPRPLNSELVAVVPIKARRPSVTTSKLAKVEGESGPRKPLLTARRSPLCEPKPWRTGSARSESLAQSPKSKSKPKPKHKPEPTPKVQFVVPSRGLEVLDFFDLDDAAFEPDVYPRPMERAEVYDHPALAYVDLKTKPADYPRPNMEDGVIPANLELAPQLATSSDSTQPLDPRVSIENVPPSNPTPPETAAPGNKPHPNISTLDFTSMTPGVYPRAMERAETYDHPALAYAGIKTKPADYPRPNIKEKAPRKSWHPTIEEAFAPPPRSPPPKSATPSRRLFSPNPASTAPSCPPPASPNAGMALMCEARLFQSYSGVLSDDARHRLYGHPKSPQPSLTREELKSKTEDDVARARHGILERAKCGVFPSARRDDGFGTASGPLLPGPHYQGGCLPSPPATGILANVRRYWVRASLALGRLLARMKARLEPSTDLV